MITLNGESLTLEEFGIVTLHHESCRLAEPAREKMLAARRVIAEIAAGERAVYGVNTGFGQLSRVRIPPDKIRQLQERLLLSHAAGVGRSLPDTVVRGMLLLRANTLARGFSGARPEVVENLLRLLGADVLPVIPSRGSVGASGDLAPLAHLALPLIGRGRVRIEGDEHPAAIGLQRAGIEPLVLEAKEGLALINGTQAMTSLLASSVLECRDLFKIADLTGAMSTDALRGSDVPFDARIHELRPHRGQQASAGNLWRLLQGSPIRESHRQDDLRVQDPYSVRCMPQVHGAARDLLEDVDTKVSIELNSVTDNPLVFVDQDEVLSGGNFHGEPMALAADCLALAVSEIGGISERRIEKLTNSAFSGLPAFLVEDAGLNSGFMIAQVTAAALASENKGLSHPASVDSIPTSADKEDHVSMGMGAALKLTRVIDNTRTILAIELISAAQGLDLLRPLTSSSTLESMHRKLRRTVEPWEEDREMALDIEAARELLLSDLQTHLSSLD